MENQFSEEHPSAPSEDIISTDNNIDSNDEDMLDSQVMEVEYYDREEGEIEGEFEEEGEIEEEEIIEEETINVEDTPQIEEEGQSSIESDQVSQQDGEEQQPIEAEAEEDITEVDEDTIIIEPSSPQQEDNNNDNYEDNNDEALQQGDEGQTDEEDDKEEDASDAIVFMGEGAEVQQEATSSENIEVTIKEEQEEKEQEEFEDEVEEEEDEIEEGELPQEWADNESSNDEFKVEFLTTLKPPTDNSGSEGIFIHLTHKNNYNLKENNKLHHTRMNSDHLIL